MNNTTPTQRPPQGQRPMQNQQPQRPQQGQRPPMQGQRPPMQGQRPPMQGQRPPMQGQRPPMQGQRPPMQGQRPPQGGQRPPQGTYRQRPQPPHGNDRFDIKTLMKFAIIITSIILVVAILIGGGVLIFSGGVGDFFADIFDGSSDKDNDKGPSVPTTNNKPSTGDSSTNKGPNIVTTLKLPSATPAGNYLSSVASGAASISGIKSEAAVLVDVGSKTAIATKNADTRIYPASMTKVMTLLVACEKATEPGKLLTVTQEMIDYQNSMDASGNLGFKAGEQITVEDALYLVNYRSDTIACLLLADYISGSEAEFVKLMNAKAKAIGLSNTNFVNTTGLHNSNHYTTCREMAAIMQCAMQNEMAKKIITSYSGRGIGIYVDNKLTRNPTVYASWYSDKSRFADSATIASGIKALGGKTGYEDIPTGCFVTVAEKGGKQYICVTVGRINESTATSVSASQSTADTKNIYRNYIK